MQESVEASWVRSTGIPSNSGSGGLGTQGHELRVMNAPTPNDCQTSYDTVADEYVRRFFDELKDKPFDRQLLDRFADSVRDVGAACDMGCGPGQVARYLHERGVQVCGVDLSPGIVERARVLNPDIEFQQGDM